MPYTIHLHRWFPWDVPTRRSLVALSLSLTIQLNLHFIVVTFSRLQFQPLRMCATQLASKDKAEMKKLLKKAGASLSREWQHTRCTHLVSPPTISVVTEKLVLAAAEVVRWCVGVDGAWTGMGAGARKGG